MIEIVYDKSDCGTNDEEFTGIKLPKNIRQMGTPSGNRRIYIEDYVMTYLNQLAKPGNTFARGAILLGEYKKDGEGEVIFVSGALEAQNFELDMDDTIFDNETWSSIYRDVKQNFSDLEVVGWFLSRVGFSTAVNDKIVKTHLDNFSGRDKVLYIIDALENEDAFYLYEQNNLKKQMGYYIYYVRNEAMQNYMVNQKGEQSCDEEQGIVKKDEELIKSYRRLLRESGEAKKAHKMNQLLYVASSVLTILVLVLGITVLSNYDKVKLLETKLNRMDLISGVNKQEEDTETVDVSVMETKENDKKETTESRKSVPTSNFPKYYVVRHGDTLTSISFQMYNSVDYVEELMRANGLEDADDLQVGEKIMIPTVP